MFFGGAPDRGGRVRPGVIVRITFRQPSICRPKITFGHQTLHLANRHLPITTEFRRHSPEHEHPQAADPPPSGARRRRAVAWAPKRRGTRYPSRRWKGCASIVKNDLRRLGCCFHLFSVLPSRHELTSPQRRCLAPGRRHQTTGELPWELQGFGQPRSQRAPKAELKTPWA